MCLLSSILICGLSGTDIFSCSFSAQSSCQLYLSSVAHLWCQHSLTHRDNDCCTMREYYLLIVQEAREMREDDDLKRATELSLQGQYDVIESHDLWVSVLCVNVCVSVIVEFNNSLPELLCSDDDSGNEDGLDMEYSEAEAEELKKNAEVRLKPSVCFKKCQFSWCSFNDCDGLFCRLESFPTLSDSSVWSVTSAAALHQVLADFTFMFSLLRCRISAMCLTGCCFLL